MVIRFSITILLFLLIDFRGAVPENNASKGVADLLLVGCTIFSVVRKRFRLNMLERFVTTIFIFFAAVALLTLLRGGSGPMDIYKFVRIYFPLLLVFPISYDIESTTNGTRYYRGLLFLIAGVVSVILFLISVLHVDFFASWPRIAYGIQEDDYILGLQRVYIFNSFTLPIAAFVILFNDFLLGRKINKLLFALITMGFLLQGYRTYIIVTVALAILLGVNYLRRQGGKRLGALLQKNMVFVIGGMIAGFSVIGGHVWTGINDLLSVSGTFASRILLDGFRFQVLADNPFFGVGFLHNDSPKARALGVTSSEELKTFAKEGDGLEGMEEAAIYSLRSTDSGYLDLLIQFGFIGIVVFLGLYFSFFRKLGRRLNAEGDEERKSFLLSARVFMLMLVFTLVTHSGITNIYGLVPLSLLLCLAAVQSKIEGA